jgi:hypothetical protein
MALSEMPRGGDVSNLSEEQLDKLSEELKVSEKRLARVLFLCMSTDGKGYYTECNVCQKRSEDIPFYKGNDGPLELLFEQGFELVYQSGWLCSDCIEKDRKRVLAL